jgi:hypothetical protein
VTSRLSDDLHTLLASADGRDLTIRQIIEALHGRGFNVFIAFLVLPFCQPIPLPGISTPFGLVLLLYGFRVAIGREPWLPQRLLDVRISYSMLSRLVAAGSLLARWIERLIKPRLRAFAAAAPTGVVNGLAIMASAFVFMLPLPIPLSNAIPAWAVLLICLGMLQDDGAAMIAGYVSTLAAWLYVGGLVWAGGAGLQRLF